MRELIAFEKRADARRMRCAARLCFGWIIAGLGLVIAGSGTGNLPGQLQRAAAVPRPPPNMVLIVSDDQPYGELSKMPFVDGRSDWTRFTRAYVNNATCCPARATILTGQYSHHTGVEMSDQGQNLDDSSTLATWLDPTYDTAFFGKYLNYWPWESATAVPPGWDHWTAFIDGAEYFDYQLNRNGDVESHGSAVKDYSTDVLRRAAGRYIRRAPEPFFVEFAPKGPHAPFTPAPRHDGDYSGAPVSHSPNLNEANSGKPDWWRDLPEMTARQIAINDKRLRHQWETLRSVDYAVKRIFDRLAERGILDRTYVFYTSDNGLAWGSHRWHSKRCAYEECIHVPLLIRGPGDRPTVSRSLVSNVDLAPTIAELAQVIPTLEVDGRSLVPTLDGLPPSGNRAILLRCGPPDVATTPPECWGVRTNRWKYIVTPASGDVELYDLNADPYEMNNISADPRYLAIQADLAQRLVNLRGW